MDFFFKSLKNHVTFLYLLFYSPHFLIFYFHCANLPRFYSRADFNTHSIYLLKIIMIIRLCKFTWNSRVELNSLPQVGRSCEIMSAHSSLIALEVIDSQLSLQSALCCSHSTLFNLTEISDLPKKMIFF